MRRVPQPAGGSVAPRLDHGSVRPGAALAAAEPVPHGRRAPQPQVDSNPTGARPNSFASGAVPRSRRHEGHTPPAPAARLKQREGEGAQAQLALRG